MAEQPLQSRLYRQTTDSRIVTMVEEALSRMSNLIIEVQRRVDVQVCICKCPNKPPNWPRAVMCLEQNVWIIKRTRNIEKLVGDFLCTRKLTTRGTKQPQSRKWRRQVGSAFKLST